MKRFLLPLVFTVGVFASVLLFAESNSSFSNFNALAVTVDDDQKLPLSAKGFSLKGNAATLTGVTYNVTDVTVGTFVPRVETDPVGVDGYFVPAGPLGETQVTVTAMNKRGQQVTGSLDVQVLAGPAVNIVIEALAPVDQ